MQLLRYSILQKMPLLTSRLHSTSLKQIETIK